MPTSTRQTEDEREPPHMPAATTSKLQEEVAFFERQRLELLERASGKYVLIKGTEVIGIFDTEIEAARAGYRQIGNEPFLIKHIVEADVPLIFTSFNLGV